jgi:hypothetical protein
VLVDIVHELPGLGRREVDVPGGAVPARDADREPARARAESGHQRAQGTGSSEFRHDVRRVRNVSYIGTHSAAEEVGSSVPVVDGVLAPAPHGIGRRLADRHLERSGA